MGVEVVKEESEGRPKVFPRMAAWWIQRGESDVVWKFGDGSVDNVKKLTDCNDVAMNRCGIKLGVGVSLALQHLLPMREHLVLCGLKVEKPCHRAMFVWLVWLSVKQVNQPESRVRDRNGSSWIVVVRIVMINVCWKAIRKRVESDEGVRIV